MYKTKKLYYEVPYACQNMSRFAVRGPNTLAVETSIAFAEGGGQLADHGWVRQGDVVAKFSNVQKVGGQPITRAEFPAITIDGEIQLHLDEPLSDAFNQDALLEITIDRIRRALLSRSHTAAHLVYIGLMAAIPSAVQSICGCYIDVTGGRFDLRSDKISAGQLAEVQRTVSEWQLASYPIVIESIPEEPECRTWACHGVRIPCGGCHLPVTGWVGSLTIQRRAKGKGLERIYYTLASDLPDEVLKMY